MDSEEGEVEEEGVAVVEEEDREVEEVGEELRSNVLARVEGSSRFLFSTWVRKKRGFTVLFLYPLLPLARNLFFVLKILYCPHREKAKPRTFEA